MKRLNIIFTFFIISILLATVSSCDIIKTDDEIVEEKIQEIINNIETGNTEGIKKLFAKNKIAKIPNFDASIESLIEYYDGTFQSKKSDSNIKFRDKDGDFSTTWFLPSFDVATSVDTYRIAFYYCTEYTTDKDSIGIWSFYIIKKIDDTTPEYAYGVIAYGLLE